jgi:hypothetical protein
MANNRIRAFSEVVTIDAWHEPFASNRPRADLCAHVVFKLGRLGGDSESPVRFKLGIKRAEIVLVRPDGEEIKIDRNSILRGTPKAKIRKVTKLQKEHGLSAALGIGAEADEKGASVNVKTEAEIKALQSKVEDILLDEDLPHILVVQSLDGRDQYQWEVSPAITIALEGEPWERDKAIVNLGDGRARDSKNPPPAVRIECRCKREDLIIKDIDIKDQSILEKASTLVKRDKKMRAVEAYVRDRLVQEGLSFTNISDPYASVTLASVSPGEPDA